RLTAAVGGVAVVAAVGVGAGVTGFVDGRWGTSGGGGAVGPGSTQAQRSAADGKLAYQAMAKVLRKLDPTGKHIVLAYAVSATEYMRPSSCSANSGGYSYLADGDWTADGKPATATSPHLTVMIELSNAKMPVKGPRPKVQLSDRSLVVGYGDGPSMGASRVLPDGRSLQIFVTDASASVDEPKPAEAVAPFPFTAQQLTAVVSDMSLKFPFADGYEPPFPCPGGLPTG
ncbi:MAG: hypothetical protein HOW97_41330, partial [Catenulispora sp.]|nr:hypothetical protein [Catenulispora sp.]